MKNGKVNIEDILSRYFEGAADKIESKTAEEYLLLHPEAMDSFEEKWNLKLDPYNDITDIQELLFKSASDLSDDQIMLISAAAAEGDLTEEALYDYESVLREGSDKRALISDFRNLRLKPFNDRFKHKTRLLKTTPLMASLKRGLVYSLAAAAVIVLLIVSKPFSWKAVDRSGIKTFLAETGEKQTVVTKDQRQQSEIIIQPSFTVSKIKNAPIEKNRPVANTGNTIPPVQEIPAKITSATTMAVIPRIALSESVNPVKIAAKSFVTVPEKVKTENWIIKGISRTVSALASIKKPANSYEIADQGIKEINKLLGWSMQLQKETAADGEKQIITFRSDLLDFSTPLKKKQ